LIFIALPFVGITQTLPAGKQGIIIIDLPHTSAPHKTKRNTLPRARTLAVQQLPFWEDFSDTHTTNADTAKWQYGRSIRVNDGMAIRPPSLKTATFDGIDSIGKPYNPNDVLAKGYADKLVSRPIDLTVLDPADTSSVYLSYMYQAKGNGEAPDAGDRLLVLFLDDASEWIPVDTIENDGSLDPTLFYTSFIKIKGEKFFHSGFQFRIQNFARLSGPYDTWNVDYIYMNKGRFSGDSAFPDRTISESFTGLFGRYRTIPMEHFKLKQDIFSYPAALGTSLQTAFNQPFDYSYEITVSHVADGDTIPGDTQSDTADVDILLVAGNFTEIPTELLPDLSTVLDQDSVQIDYKFWLNSGDNVPYTEPEGDYHPEIYAPIDFRSNDTTYTTFYLQNKYAYDDGVSEYGAALNQPGAQLAYKYELLGVEEENITYLEMYFPRFGDESSQVLELRIWNDLNENPVYTEIATLQRSEDNVTWVKRLTQPVKVGPTFYVGWKQSVAAVIAVGLDKNTGTGNLMYYNTDGNWVQNELIHGSLMMRPVFGDLVADTTGIEEVRDLAIYPNPSSGTIYFNGVGEMISVHDMTGRSIPFDAETTTEETKLAILNASRGIYIIRAHIAGQVRTAKVMIR
jgi:hypothetical protein